MKATRYAIPLLALILAATGCVSQSEYDELDLLYRKAQEQNELLRAQIAELENRLARIQQSDTATAEEIARLTEQRNELRAQLDRLEQRYRELEDRGPLVIQPELDAALRDFAEDHPQLVSYDPAMGMVKLRSDLTFALGSADLRAEAKATLTELADILQGRAASQYEVRVIGHTDNVPIRKPATKQKHPTNWHLSVHRAIAVRDALEAEGLPAVRTSVAGYSMYRPVVTNDRKGAEANRRVELYLKPMPRINQDMINPQAGQGN